MPTRRNDALDAHLNAYFRISSAGVNRNDIMLSEAALAQLRDILYAVQPIVVPASMFDSAPVSFEIATEEPQEEAGVESNEELDNFLKEFVLKEVC